MFVTGVKLRARVAVMRRAAATVLFAVLAVPILLPLYAFRNSDPDSQLPACCRRDGKHHCGMAAAEQTSDSSPALRASSPRCPFWLSRVTVSRNPKFQLAASSLFYGDLARHPAFSPQAYIHLVVSEKNTHHKRGPPFLVA